MGDSPGKVVALIAVLMLFAIGCAKPSEVRDQSARDAHAEASDAPSSEDAEGDEAATDAEDTDGDSSAVIGGDPGASGGGGGPGGGSGAGDASKEVKVPPTSSGPTVGVTKTTIKVGFIVVSNNDKLLAGYGVRGGAIGDTRDQVQAVVDDVNARGGILGRKIVPVFRELSATGDGTAQYSAMCSGFTQDDKVFAVIAPWNPDPAFAPCLAKKGTFYISDALLQYDGETFTQYAPYVVSGLFNSSRGAKALATGLHKQGYFKGAKLGVVHSDNPIYKRVYEAHFKPTLASFGVKPAAVFAASGTGAANDAVLYMKARNITHVVFLSAAGGNPLFFMNFANSQNYFPVYGIGSPDSPAFLAQNAPYTQLRRARAVGWAPAFDVLDSEGPPLSANEKRCLDVHAKGGTDYGTRTEAAAIAMAFCDMIWLFEEAADKAGTNLTKQSWSNALAALGSSHKTTLTFGTRFERGGFDGAVAYRPIAYDDAPNCRCFKYVGATAPVGR